MRDFIFYIRDEKGFPIACVAAIPKAAEGAASAHTAIGISIYNPRDCFDKALGRKIAQGRAEMLFTRLPGTKHELAFFTDAINMADFKHADFPVRVKLAIAEAIADGALDVPGRLIRALNRTDEQK